MLYDRYPPRLDLYAVDLPGYIPGFFYYAQAHKEAGTLGIGLTKGELVAVIICVLGVISVPMTFMGIIPVF